MLRLVLSINAPAAGGRRFNRMNQSRSKRLGIWNKTWRIFPWIEFYPGESTLAWGLSFLALTAAVGHFVMFWLLTALTAPVSILLLVRGFGAARGAGRMTRSRWAGVGLLFGGMVFLSLAAETAAAFSYGWALESMGHVHALNGLSLFGTGIWLWCAMSTLFSAMLLTPGLARWTDWPARRIQIWSRIFLAFPLITILLHQLLTALGGPLTA
jgi:hypothetical protein